MMTKFYPVLFSLFLLAACSADDENQPSESSNQAEAPKPAQADSSSRAPELLWQLDGLLNPESVIFDAETNALYVSNVNGAPDGKDGNGFISKISPEGELLGLKWVEGLNAPKGLTISKGKLYVADIDELIEIDIASASISQRWKVADAKFLNDVTADASGKVYVSDMVTNRIHILHAGDFSIWLEDAALENPNGLHAEAERLVVGCWGVMTDGFATETPGHLKAVNYSDKSISSIGSAEAVGNLDGVEADLDTYLVTDWMAGKLFRIDQSGQARLLLQLEQGMADHEWLEQSRLLLIPMMNNNQLLAYFLP